MKSTLLLFSTFVLAIAVQAQVPRKVLAEHFTNTRCSICASRNPGFFGNLANFPDVIRLGVHPSSPYSSCLLNQHNTVENDARTNFYGVYGATPRLVIQGAVLPVTADFEDPTIFSSAEGMQSNYSLHITQELRANQDSVFVSVTIRREASDSLGTAWLYVALAESELLYAAPNGENEHYNVFRESLFGSAGMSISVPANVGDSVTYSASVSVSDDWNLDEVYALAVLQDETSNEVLQAESAEDEPLNVIAGLSSTKTEVVTVFPNPFKDELVMTGLAGSELVEIYDLLGQPVFSGQISGRLLDLSHLQNGAYILRIKNGDREQTQRIIKN